MDPPISRRAVGRILAIAAAVVPALGSAAAQGGSHGPVEGMLEVTIDGRRIEGVPLALSSRWIHVLGRDGRLWKFTMAEVDTFRSVSTPFRSYSPSEIRAQLLRELGNEFEVSGTGHYLIAHPRGQKNLWARRFEELYRSFVHYFAVRGFDLDEPEFPLVGIVSRNREEFVRLSVGHGVRAGPGMIGFYDIESNRIVVYDTGDRGDTDDWMQIGRIIIHEATHQTAFNTGIHNRCAVPPLWVAEGLALLFEAPGVYNARVHRDLVDRINRRRLDAFRGLVAGGWPEGILAEMVGSDQVFSGQPEAAYAVAWALTFYLVETQPDRYAEYVARTAKRPAFERYTSGQRRADFEGVFGGDLRMLEARVLRYMESLP